MSASRKSAAKAYSYIRFSTPEQSKGDSLRRQTEAARDYAARRGLELDESLTFRDTGVSAFTGRNAEAGALAAFLKAVEDGDVAKGSFLIVESLDRVSRQTARKAVRTMEDIVEAGVTVVDLSDGGKEYSAETLDGDTISFFMMVVRFMRAHEESATKSKRLRAAYSNKRKQLLDATTAKPFTRRLPAWLRWDNDKAKFVLIQERTRLLRQIFRRADEGWGKHKMVRWLNERQEPTWGDGKRKAEFWHASYVQKLLTNPSVVGTFIPHETHKQDGGKRTRTPLKPREGYFPAAIDPGTFERVRAQASAKAPRGRNASSAPKSIFAGIIRCAQCGKTVTRVSKGEHVYLVCSRANAKAKGCEYRTVPYREAERAMLGDNARVMVREAPRGMEAREIDTEIAKLELQAEEAGADAMSLSLAAARNRSEATQAMLREKEAERDDALKRARELRIKRETVASPSVKRKLEAMRAALAKEPLDIAEANTAMKQVLKAVVMNAEARTLTLHWHHSEQTTEGPPIVPLSWSGIERAAKKSTGR